MKQKLILFFEAQIRRTWRINEIGVNLMNLSSCSPSPVKTKSRKDIKKRKRDKKRRKKVDGSDQVNEGEEDKDEEINLIKAQPVEEAKPDYDDFYASIDDQDSSHGDDNSVSDS